MYVSADDAFWNPMRLADLVTRVNATARARGTTPRRPLPVTSPGAMAADRTPSSSSWLDEGHPVFGGFDDDADGVAPSHSSRRLQALDRLKARALLFANPETPCSTLEVANVFRLRERRVRDARPNTAQWIGRAWMAPFGHWLVALRHAGLVPVWPDEMELPTAAPPPRSCAPARHRSGHLRPLGGPHGR